MQFSKKTIDALKNFAQINPELWMTKGYDVKTVNSIGTIFAYTTLDDHIDESFGIHDLHSFLDLLSMMGPEATIEFDKEKQLIFMKNKYSKIMYATTPQESINGGNAVPNLVLPTPKLTFELKADILSQVMKISKKTGVNAIAIESEGGMIKINGYQVAEIKRNLGDPKMFSFDIAPYDGSNNFKFMLNIANMAVPLMDYSVDIHIIGINMMANFVSDTTKIGISIEVASEHDYED